MIKALALLTLLQTPSPNSWFGADKAKHFLVSAFVHSVAFSASRAAGIERPNSQLIGGVSTLTVGLWKETRDRRLNREFSATDLVWDAAGGLAAAALLNGTR